MHEYKEVYVHFSCQLFTIDEAPGIQLCAHAMWLYATMGNKYQLGKCNTKKAFFVRMCVYVYCICSWF